jgi:hypothetical protein
MYEMHPTWFLKTGCYIQPGTVLGFGTLEFMSPDGSYDMVLLPSQHDNNDGRRLARRR